VANKREGYLTHISYTREAASGVRRTPEEGEESKKCSRVGDQASEVSLRQAQEAAREEGKGKTTFVEATTRRRAKSRGKRKRATGEGPGRVPLQPERGGSARNHKVRRGKEGVMESWDLPPRSRFSFV